MEWLNYHHLLYFWVVAREGSIAKASRELRLAHPTISAQVHRLEQVLGVKLFARSGRKLVLTDVGRIAFRYADEIFSLGGEFLDVMKGRAAGRTPPLIIGIANSLPKALVHRVLEPIVSLATPVRVVCREDRATDAFLRDLAVHELDLVLCDAPAPPNQTVRVFNHVLGDCGTAFMAAPQLARAVKRRFPQSLSGMPFVMPSRQSAMHRVLDGWFDQLAIRPQIVAEVDDAALIKRFGEAGLGVFTVPDAVESEVGARHRVRCIGHVAELRQRFYAVSVERRIRHPAVAAILEHARGAVFAPP
jgi:LysR family transcriptional activator of nhaA